MSVADGRTDPVIAARAKLQIGRSARHIGQEAIQMHGGLGFTWEGSPHLYFKRATTDALTLGSASEHVDRVGRLAIDTVA